MKLVLKIVLGIFLLTIAINLAELPFALFKQDTAYQSCALLRVDFPAGVSRDKAAATVIAYQAKAKPTIDPDVYKLNTMFDKDNNGTACQNKYTEYEKYVNMVRASRAAN